MQRTDDTRVASVTPLVSPAELKAKVEITPEVSKTVAAARQVIADIIRGKDHRLLAIVGPCSIHDVKAAEDYARRMAILAERFRATLFVVMRAYFEKPRTALGWKGLIDNHRLNGRSDPAAGLEMARRLLLTINELGLPTATEWLGPLTPAYLADLVSWAAIGARTTESQTHRDMASGLSMPVGMKNGTSGDCEIAMNAMLAAQGQHSFLGINRDGATSIIETAGNPHCHIILRGGTKPNYSDADIARVVVRLNVQKLCPRVVVDCSHGNSKKDWRLQPEVCRDVVAQRVAGNASIVGLMLESNHEAGNQPLPTDLSDFDPTTLKYGVSVTDGCVDLNQTEELLAHADSAIQRVL